MSPKTAEQRVGSILPDLDHLFAAGRLRREEERVQWLIRMDRES